MGHQASLSPEADENEVQLLQGIKLESCLDCFLCAMFARQRMTNLISQNGLIEWFQKVETNTKWSTRCSPLLIKTIN